MASGSPKPLTVYHIGHEVYLVPLGPLHEDSQGVLFDPSDGTLAEPRSLGSIVAHVGTNDWEEVPEAEIPPALQRQLANLG